MTKRRKSPACSTASILNRPAYRVFKRSERWFTTGDHRPISSLTENTTKNLFSVRPILLFSKSLTWMLNIFETNVANLREIGKRKRKKKKMEFLFFCISLRLLPICVATYRQSINILTAVHFFYWLQVAQILLLAIGDIYNCNRS